MVFLLHVKYFALTYILLIGRSWLGFALFLVLLLRDLALMHLWTALSPFFRRLIVASWFNIFRTVERIDRGIWSKFIPCGRSIEYFFLGLGSQPRWSISGRTNRIHSQIPIRWCRFLKDLTFPNISHFPIRLLYFDSTLLILDISFWISRWGRLYLRRKTLYKFLHWFSRSLLLVIYKFEIVFGVLEETWYRSSITDEILLDTLQYLEFSLL